MLHIILDGITQAVKSFKIMEVPTMQNNSQVPKRPHWTSTGCSKRIAHCESQQKESNFGEVIQDCDLTEHCKFVKD